ncbi:very-long-chain enoyl-CoA reductase [Elysia marginata]|uniref:Very-long-chain enoyl-CoA reductase n=1 Tax=Elysia marginata TaxID=1093978 RepID=A0AAV4EV91_9GAST|nr:very-long-chain enoyl-CoA reductase [Elysia marginata]
MPKIEVYLSTSQSGFRPNRSTSDVIWAHGYLTAKVQKDANLEINTTGIDMSAAFDTTNRKELLTILKEIVEEDELRIIQFLLSETTLDVKVNGCTQENPFTTNIGTLQGDSLSQVFFIIYVENALRISGVRKTTHSGSLWASSFPASLRLPLNGYSGDNILGLA